MLFRATTFFHLASAGLAATIQSQPEADITINPISNVDEANSIGYFSDPFHVPYNNNQAIYISGTSHAYMTCGKKLEPACATEPFKKDTYQNSKGIEDEAKSHHVSICGGGAGIHPYQSPDGSWDAVLTLHVRNSSSCDGHWDWSIIIHAHPQSVSGDGLPPNAWIGDQLLVGSFTDNVDANYDGKYFRTPEDKLYLGYQKRDYRKAKKRDGVVAWPMDDPKTKSSGSKPIWLLLPDEDLNSENYVAGNNDFKLIETGNIRAINGTFVMAYSVGAYNRKTYKLGVAFSDTFLPGGESGQYRKVMKQNPEHLWNSTLPKEVYYLLQADAEHAGWRYIGNKVLAPGVPTVADIGVNGWVLTFAGFNPGDTGTPQGQQPYKADHRRPFYIDLHVNLPANASVKDASDKELRKWITPA